MKERLILKQVEMTPNAFWLMVVKLRTRAARRTCLRKRAIVNEIDVDFVLVESQINTFNVPRLLYVKELAKKLFLAHELLMR